MSVDREALRQAAKEFDSYPDPDDWARVDYTSTVSPDVVLALLTESEAVEAERDRLREEQFLVRQELASIRETLERIDKNSVTLWKQRDEARAECDRLREALEFYANPNHWNEDGVCEYVDPEWTLGKTQDEGFHARRALGTEQEVDQQEAT